MPGAWDESASPAYDGDRQDLHAFGSPALAWIAAHQRSPVHSHHSRVPSGPQTPSLGSPPTAGASAWAQASRPEGRPVAGLGWRLGTLRPSVRFRSCRRRLTRC